MGTLRTAPAGWLRRFGDPALLVGLVASFLALAVLQHRWTLQASRSEEQRLRALLQERVRNFAREVDGAASQVALRSWVDPEWLARQPDRRAALAAFAAAAWRDSASSPLPALVREMLVVDTANDGEPRLSRLDSARGELQPAEWPADLQAFRRFLVRLRHGETDWRDPAGPGPTAGSAYGLLPEVPAVVVASSWPPEAGQRLSHRPERGPEHARPLDECLIVRLDADFVTREWLPALVARHFPASEYDVVVRAGGEGTPLLFAALPARARDVLAAPDARAQLLKLDLGELGVFREHVLTGGPGHLERPEPPREVEPRPLAAVVPAATGPALPALAEVEPREQPRRLRELLRARAREDAERVAWLSEVMAERGWQLRVRHRAGSLAAAAARTRVRSLLLSYGILLLLAASCWLMVRSARAARRLARQQLEFVAFVSHELRTPVAAVRALSTNLADGLVRSDEQVVLYGRHLQQQSRRLGELVERTLLYAGIESGVRRYASSELDLAEVARRAASLCAPAAGPSRVDLEIEGELPSVRGDAEALASAVRNLVDNALRYSPAGERVSLRVQRCGTEVVVSVADRGTGIDPADLPQLFEPFYRGTNALRDGAGGVGIGLTLTRRIVEAHGGRVEVETGGEAGTCFRLRLPIPEAKP